MLIVDYSQVVIGSIMVNLAKEAKSTDPGLRGMIKHLFLSSLLSYQKKFKDREVVIACDSKNYWRRDYFPYYKMNRKETRESSDLNWEMIFSTMDEMKTDLKENFRYKVIESPAAEADDVIACLVKYLQTHELIQDGVFCEEPKEITIISADTDFCQLQKYKNVKQYSQMQKKMVKPNTSLTEFINEHIVRGDSGDGIPNILSPDNCIVEHIRQSQVRKNVLERYLKVGIDACENEEQRRNYVRNQTLIDFDFIPQRIYDAIVKEYEEYIIKGNKNRILNFMMKNKMKLLIDSVGDF